MIKSIRYFLLISLLASITIASAINGVGNYLLDEQVIEPYLDAQLIRMSAVLLTFNQATISNIKMDTELIETISKKQTHLDEKIIFQLWDNNGKLLLRSHNYPHVSLKNTPLGFSDQLIQREDYRTYNTYY